MTLAYQQSRAPYQQVVGQDVINNPIHHRGVFK
jgi:pyrroloquinoline-quinone synthase